MDGVVSEVMQRDVVSVRPDTPFREVVRILAERRVGGLPVLDVTGRVVGVVTESDLLLKEELIAHAAAGLGFVPAVRRERAKAAAGTVEGIMSSPAITVSPSTMLGEAAHVMHKRRVGRLPVVDTDGELVGIITRGDVLAVFLRDDEELRSDIGAAVGALPTGDARHVTIDVRDGVVVLSGTVRRRSAALAAAAAVRTVPGVCGLEDRTHADFDDVHVAIVGP